MDFRADLSKQRQSIASTALAIARDLEAGRAQAPFQEKLHALTQADVTLPVRAALIADQPDDLHALLSEIIGQDYNVCKVVVPSRLGFSEVLLQEKGFLLDTGAGTQEFADSGAFLTALQQTHALQPSDDGNLEPLRLKLKGPTHLNGLCLLIPHSLDALVRKPALLSTLADQADWVFLAGNPRTTFDAPQRQTIQLVLDHVTGLQSIQRTPADHDPASTPPAGDPWWKNWQVALSLGLVRLGTELQRKRLGMLTEPSSELRRYLIESRLVRQLEMALGLMAEEVQQAQRQLGNRINLTREGLTDRGNQPDARKTAETIRNKLGDELDSLLKAAERDAKASLQTDGEANQRLRQAATSISVDDIEQNAGEVVIKLTLSPAATARLCTTVLELARQRLTTDLQQVHEGLECSVRDAKRAIEAATGTRPAISVELPDEGTLWDTISNLARPEIRYRGEMPRTTLGTRFNAARQVIMGVMILGTILGGAAVLTGEQSGGQSIRAYLGAIMIPLLIIGFLWTYVSFRKKENQLLEKEAEKLQDGVLSELRRVLQDLHREQMTIVNGALQKAQRAIQQQIDSTFEKISRQKQGEADDLRRRQGEQQQSIDQRIVRFRQYQGELSTLQSRATEAQNLQARWLADWITRFNQGKV